MHKIYKTYPWLHFSFYFTVFSGPIKHACQWEINHDQFQDTYCFHYQVFILFSSRCSNRDDIDFLLIIASFNAQYYHPTCFNYAQNLSNLSLASFSFYILYMMPYARQWEINHDQFQDAYCFHHHQVSFPSFLFQVSINY